MQNLQWCHIMHFYLCITLCTKHFLNLFEFLGINYLPPDLPLHNHLAVEPQSLDKPYLNSVKESLRKKSLRSTNKQAPKQPGLGSPSLDPSFALRVYEAVTLCTTMRRYNHKLMCLILLLKIKWTWIIHSGLFWKREELKLQNLGITRFCDVFRDRVVKPLTHACCWGTVADNWNATEIHQDVPLQAFGNFIPGKTALFDFFILIYSCSRYFHQAMCVLASVERPDRWNY